MTSPSTLLMTLDCPDRIGLLATITGFVAAQRGNFIEVNQYTDTINEWFWPASSSRSHPRPPLIPSARLSSRSPRRLEPAGRCVTGLGRSGPS
jgi:hypothetical protein